MRSSSRSILRISVVLVRPSTSAALRKLLYCAQARNDFRSSQDASRTLRSRCCVTAAPRCNSCCIPRFPARYAAHLAGRSDDRCVIRVKERATLAARHDFDMLPPKRGRSMCGPRGIHELSAYRRDGATGWCRACISRNWTWNDISRSIPSSILTFSRQRQAARRRGLPLSQRPRA